MSELQRKIVVFSLGGLIIIIAIWQWAIAPLINYQNKLDQSIAVNTKRLKQFLTYEQQLKHLLATTTSNQSVQKKLPADFTLFSYLDNLATKNNLKQNIDFLRPSNKQISDEVSFEIVDLRLKAVRLGKLMPFLAKIESSEYAISIDRLTIRTEKEPGLLDVDLTCSIVRKGQ